MFGRRKPVRLGLTVLPCILLIVLLYRYINMANQETNQVRIGNIVLDPDTGTLTIESQAAFSVKEDLVCRVEAIKGETLNKCGESSGGEMCFQFGDKVQLRFSRHSEGCYKLSWRRLPGTSELVSCFDLGGALWYGGSEMLTQLWPSSLQTADMKPYLSMDQLQDRSASAYGSVLERYWISSSGFAIHVPNEVPLHASLNENGDHRLCLKADYHKYYPRTGDLDKNEDGFPSLTYYICQARDVVEVHQLASPLFYYRPSSLPDERMFRFPVWSTWARYKVHVSQSAVMEYAKEINHHGFPNSQIEIDDMWTPSYGEYVFDEKKFPSPEKMISELKEMNFRVTAWATPFTNVDSPAFTEGSSKGFFLKGTETGQPGLVKWWQGRGGVLDVFNKEAVKWYKDKLNNLMVKTGLDSFKFDAGELHFLPSSFSTDRPIMNPSDYTTKYAEVVASFGKMVEMRAAYRSQKHPMFVRMMDKDSVWGYVNGLKTMIPTALLFSVLGYHFDLPDMIGGNGYPEEDDGFSGLQSTILPDRELYIRWVQLSAYLPSMQFSIAPWQYDEEVVEIARKAVEIHHSVVTPIVLEAGKKAVSHGTPIIRPLWWHDPLDRAALECDSQFLVGASLLVAPILENGARSRDVYLPNGSWLDELQGRTLQGPLWLKDYRTALSDVATFVLQEQDNK